MALQRMKDAIDYMSSSDIIVNGKRKRDMSGLSAEERRSQMLINNMQSQLEEQAHLEWDYTQSLPAQIEKEIESKISPITHEITNDSKVDESKKEKSDLKKKEDEYRRQIQEKGYAGYTAADWFAADADTKKKIWQDGVVNNPDNPVNEIKNEFKDLKDGITDFFDNMVYYVEIFAVGSAIVIGAGYLVWMTSEIKNIIR